MDKIIIYHGSSEIVKQPVYGKGKPYNDYGIGFYCTEHLELAKEWACTKNIDGFVNEYELDLTHLKVLHLSEYLDSPLACFADGKQKIPDFYSGYA